MRILHVFRSPVGGLFRHVRDLARGQSDLGHDVGIFCDSNTGGQNAIDLLEQTAPFCKLGITREAMSKLPGFGDISCAQQTLKLAQRLNVDIIHGHGAKGGLYARMAAKFGNKTGIYTPHGGSLHYEWNKLPGPLFLGTEWLLRKTNSGMVFVCEFEKQLFQSKIGLSNCKSTVVHNGLWPEEFTNVQVSTAASDLLFVGEMRKLKGVDVLLRAIAILNLKRRLTATLVGEGPDLDMFKALASELNIASNVNFVGLKKMKDAIDLGRVFVLPSRNESFPYVMLEAIAANRPIIGSNVGGIGEVVPHDQLCAADSPDQLAKLIETVLDNPAKAQECASALATKLRTGFSVPAMASKITLFYQTCL